MPEIYLENTARGLVPVYDRDYDEKKKLVIGKVYKAQVTLARNYRFLKKYFALIDCSWEYLNESIQEKVYHNSKEGFRKSVEIAAGYYETIYSLSRKEFVQMPMSIAFDKMDEARFSDLYERVKDVLFKVFLKHVSKEKFEKNLMNF